MVLTAPIFINFTTTKRHCMEISCMEFHQNQWRNIESAVLSKVLM